MRIETEEWLRFTPGVRTYKEKKTLFYNGEKLWGNFRIYNKEERQSWEVIIVLPGVEVIPKDTFDECFNVEIVIMTDSVRRIEDKAFYHCGGLQSIKLSRNLEYIGRDAFAWCNLTSIFIPPACREISTRAFYFNDNLIILHVPQHTQLGQWVVDQTALSWTSPFERDIADAYWNNDEVHEWVKNMNMENQYVLHRICSSFDPSIDTILDSVKRHGLNELQRKNAIGITPLQYLHSNPYTEISEIEMLKQYILEMMGEVI